MTAQVLVVGARSNSLGEAIGVELVALGAQVILAGIEGEGVQLDVMHSDEIWRAIVMTRPTHLVCTVGTNVPSAFDGKHWNFSSERTMRTNFHGPMKVLSEFSRIAQEGTFVAISSNSASIPRSNSTAYCASKAALSMGLRCAARDVSRREGAMRIWGYEPGLIADTPMTDAVAAELPGVALTRMLSLPGGLEKADLAARVARDVLSESWALHGCLVRIDNGEI